VTLSPGAHLGPYEILGALGAGGMGEVYRARDTRLQREVAVKVLPASYSQDPDRLRRFEQEARAASAINHPNILTVHDVGQHDGAPYVVTELLEGETLRDRMAAGALSPRRALEHALQIAHGLAAAHDRGIVHRDLKPENVFATRDGRVKILDFGLASVRSLDATGREQTAAAQHPMAGIDVSAARTVTENANLTAPGSILGTVGYMSPEQVRGKPADARSDIFAFGAILYEMLSGKRAFHGDTAAVTMSSILTKDPPELSATNRDVSPGLDRVVRHCLEKDPERRFHSAHDLAFGLEALSDSSGARPPLPPPARAWKRIALPIAAAAAILAAAAGIWLRRSTAAETALDSIAVLPFVNTTRDPETEYLSDGITESIINSLSRLPQLRVVARSSVFRYKGRGDDPQRVGRELKVRAIVSGKVIQRGDTLSVQADLVDVGNGSQIWGDHYDRKLSDILAIQEEIANDISEKLRLRLTGDQKEKLRKRYTESTEAYQLYLKGRYAWEKRTSSGLRQSSEYFQKAIENDPTFALAYSGLADSYVVLPAYSILAPAEGYPKARAAARKALEVDDGLAAAHATLGLILTLYDHDWPSAESELKRAIELDPTYATAPFWYGLLLSSLGRTDEALDQIQKAREADPFSAIIRSNAVRFLVFARRFDRAIPEGRKAAQEFPNFAQSHLFLATAYEATGMRTEAAAEFRKAGEVSGRTPQGLFHLGSAQAVGGQRSEALATIDELKALAARGYVSPAFIAGIFLRLGEKDEGFVWLDRACDDRSYETTFLKVDPLFDGVRSDPRFADLLRKAGFAPPAR
jgi:eukaryotic-like serine/threonine-protein kinase